MILKHVTVDTNLEDLTYPVGLNLSRNLRTITRMADRLRDVVKSDQKVNLVCMGSSGAIIAALILSQMTDTSLFRVLHVKKDGECSHSGCASERVNAEDVNVFVDDFIRTGNTLKRTAKKLGHPLHGIVITGGICDSLLRELPSYPEFVICESYNGERPSSITTVN
jgi:pyrimidine operon attenuation protein/uracil phosphoribosyltransferase